MLQFKAFFLSIFFLGLSLAHSEASAGAWTSGGGELIKDRQNPWFLRNVTDVSYCIKVGPDFSEQSITVLASYVEEAVNYWQHLFSLARPFKKSRMPRGSVIDFMGRQAFHYEQCRAETDIVFQFGILNEIQRQFIGDPTRFVALAIRTDYDPVNLRGKGFVYVSPDRGSDRYAGDELVDLAWTRGDGGLLQATLIHEFGHIFGFPHIPGYAPGQMQWAGIMSERFTEQILDKKISNIFETRSRNFPFLIFDHANSTARTLCTPALDEPRVFDFFGGDPRNGHCFEFRLTQTGMDVFQKQLSRNPQDRDPQSVFLGRIDVDGGLLFQAGSIRHSNYGISDLYLSPDQRVFDLRRSSNPRSHDPVYNPNMILSYTLHELVVFKLNGTYRSRNGGLNRVLKCEIGPADFVISTEFRGRLYEDIIGGF